MSPRAQPAPDPDRLARVTTRRKGGMNPAEMAELYRREALRDWPSGMPKPPPYPVDDEGQEAPNDHT